MDDKNKAINIDEIDLEKLELATTSIPSSLPYAHSRGSAPIKIINRKHIAKRGIEAMNEQVDIQIKQIMEQVKLLSEQVEGLKEKKKLSQIIYGAQMNFRPIPRESYYLYEKDQEYILSILSPQEWGESFMSKQSFVAKVYLSGDYSWEILESGQKIKVPTALAHQT